jgi:hypothetical protein
MEIVNHVREEHREAIAAALRDAGGQFVEYGKPNTILIPTRGSPPIPYYSPRRPTRALRVLCWLIGATLDYLPDREPRAPRTVPTPRAPMPPTKPPRSPEAGGLIIPPGVDPVIARRVLAAQRPRLPDGFLTEKD